MQIPRECFDTFLAKALERSNYYRLRHNVPVQNMSNSVDLQTMARNYACKIVTDFKFMHNVDKGFIGENLMLFKYKTPFNLTTSFCSCIYLIFILFLNQ